jgi:hypothetical protein
VLKIIVWRCAHTKQREKCKFARRARRKKGKEKNARNCFVRRVRSTIRKTRAGRGVQVCGKCERKMTSRGIQVCKFARRATRKVEGEECKKL